LSDFIGTHDDAPASNPRAKLLLFLLAFFATGLLVIWKFDTYFTDFWKIKDCRLTGQSANQFMTGCQGIKVDRYNFGAVYLGIEKDAVKSVRNADVLIFGNSRTARSFSTDTIDRYFNEKGLSYMVMAYEGSHYSSVIATLDTLKLNPKIALINNEILYNDKLSEGVRELVEYPDKYKTRYQFFYTAKKLQRAICNSGWTGLKKYYCQGHKQTTWRDKKTGRQSWNLTVPIEKQKLVLSDGVDRMSFLGMFNDNASGFFGHPRMRNSCSVLYLVNSPMSEPDIMRRMAIQHKKSHVFSQVEGLYTFDDSHLDRNMSEKWARSFVRDLDPAIDQCLGETGDHQDRTVDFKAFEERGYADFETWRRFLQAEVQDQFSNSYSGEETADLVKFPETGSRIQRLYAQHIIEKGATVRYSLNAASESPKKIRLRLIRSCSRETEPESAEIIKEISGSSEIILEHKFEHAHKCVLVQITSLSPDSEIILWNGNFQYFPPDQQSKRE